MSDAIPLPFDLPAVRRKKLTVDFGGGGQIDGNARAVSRSRGKAPPSVSRHLRTICSEETAVGSAAERERFEHLLGTQ